MTDRRRVAQAKFDDEDYPAYTMGRAADMLEVTQAFLRSLEAAGLITPQRSAGGHRRYSRAQLVLAARVRELLDTHTALSAACHIAVLEADLPATQRRRTTARTRIPARPANSRTTWPIWALSRVVRR